MSPLENADGWIICECEGSQASGQVAELRTFEPYPLRDQLSGSLPKRNVPWISGNVAG